MLSQELISVKWYRLNCAIFSQVIDVGNLFNKICLHNVQKNKFRIIVAYRKNGFHVSTTMTYESWQKCLGEHLKNVFSNRVAGGKCSEILIHLSKGQSPNFGSNINLFHATGLFLYPLKTVKNL